MLDTGAAASMDISWLFAPLELTMMGEFSAISFSERLLHRMTTWMFVSGWSPPALFVSSVERVEFVNFDITERERVGGLGGCIALLLIAVRGREAA